jgi:hypothetical protein
LLIQDENGHPRPNVDVRVYDAEAGPQQGWYGKTFDNTPDQYYTTDDAGYVHLPQNPFNPGGQIEHTYGIANGVIILRVQQGTQIWYRFLEVADFNMEYWRGHTQDAYYTLTLPGQTPTPASPTATPIAGQQKQGDLNCSGAVNSTDALDAVRFVVGLAFPPGPNCVAVGADFAGHPFGDVNCDGVVDQRDAIMLLQHAAGLPLDPPQPGGCTPIEHIFTG